MEKAMAYVQVERKILLRRAALFALLGALVLLLEPSRAQDQNGSGSGGMNQNLSCPGSTSTSCSQLPVRCLQCELNMSCTYGARSSVNCKPLEGIDCEVGDLPSAVAIWPVTWSGGPKLPVKLVRADQFYQEKTVRVRKFWSGFRKLFCACVETSYDGCYAA